MAVADLEDALAFSVVVFVVSEVVKVGFVLPIGAQHAPAVHFVVLEVAHVDLQVVQVLRDPVSFFDAFFEGAYERIVLR